MCGISNTAALYMTLGNHEMESGYQQHSNIGTRSGPKQKQATIGRKRMWCNPTNTTYVEGGENGSEGDWIPTGTNTLGEAYDDDYVFDYILEEGATSFDDNTENASPLENYYAWTWGDTLFVVLDVYRYTDPGDVLGGSATNVQGTSPAIGAGGSHRRWGGQWTLGSTQTNWLAGVLSSSSAQWKVVISHQNLSGESIGAASNFDDPNEFYGRGSGINLSSSEEQYLLNLFRQNGVTVWFKGHDHCFCHVINNTLNIVSLPTSNAPSHTVNGGWHHTELQDSYGTAESLGAKDSSGTNMPSSLIKSYNVMGYVLCDITSTSFTITFRQTAAAVDTDLITPTYATERYVGSRTTQSGSVVTVSEPPKDVVFAINADTVDYSLDDDWYDTDLLTSDIYTLEDRSLYDIEEDYATNDITLDAVVGDVSLTNIPRDLYSVSLDNSIAPPFAKQASKPSIVVVRVSESTQSSTVSLTKDRATTFTIPSISISGSLQTHFQIFKRFVPLTELPEINVTSSSNIRTNGNLIRLNRTTLSIILKSNTVYKFRYRLLRDGGWSEWSDVLEYRTRDLDYKSRRGKRFSTVTDLFTEADTSRGATVVNNSTNITETRTSKGATIINPETDDRA